MDLNDVPASGNRWLLHDVLRQEWGFKGFVVSDAFAVGKSCRRMATLAIRKTPPTRRFSAGLNMDMASLTYIRICLNWWLPAK